MVVCSIIVVHVLVSLLINLTFATYMPCFVAIVLCCLNANDKGHNLLSLFKRRFIQLFK